MIVAIHQPNYIPWLGYFYKIYKSDLFVLLDNVQFPKESPAARNYIKAKDSTKFLLTVSVKKSKGAYQNYNELEIDYSSKWNTKHINQLKDSYIKAPFFNDYFPIFENILKLQFTNLAELNIKIILMALELLKIETRIEIASKIDNEKLGTKNDRNLNICLHYNASKYLSGIGAQTYNDAKLFDSNGIELIYSDFKSIQYPQINGEFLPNLSFLDALFNVGAEGVSKLIKNNY
jgi:hypothetical protein